MKMHIHNNLAVQMDRKDWYTGNPAEGTERGSASLASWTDGLFGRPSKVPLQCRLESLGISPLRKPKNTHIARSL